jgi:hypothetical protein
MQLNLSKNLLPANEAQQSCIIGIKQTTKCFNPQFTGFAASVHFAPPLQISKMLHLQCATQSEARRRLPQPCREVPHSSSNGAHSESATDVIKDPVWTRFSTKLLVLLLAARHFVCARSAASNGEGVH